MKRDAKPKEYLGIIYKGNTVFPHTGRKIMKKKEIIRGGALKRVTGMCGGKVPLSTLPQAQPLHKTFFQHFSVSQDPHFNQKSQNA